MRHFRSSPSAIAALTRGMGKAAPARFLVAPSRLSAGLTAGRLRAALTAVDVAPVAVATDHHLAATPGTVEQTRAALHRLLLPMRAGLKPNPKRYSPVGRVSHGLGARHRVDCGGQSRCRAFLNGPADLADCAQLVTPATRCPHPNTPPHNPPFQRPIFASLNGDNPPYSPNRRSFPTPSTMPMG